MKKNAFTLVELIVAISIMSIVLVLAIPSIGAISERNARKRYENYGETLVSSGKLYTDSNAIDMFGYESDGCFDIYFDALKEKKLAKDIDYKDITCADGGDGQTYVKVRKLDDEIKYQLSMVCRDEKGEVVYDDLIDSSDILCDGRAPHTGPEITVSPEKQEAYLSENETYKVSIKVHDDDGLLENNEVEYSWCRDPSCTSVIGTTRLRYENKRDADIKTVNKKIPRPKGDGEYYLKVRSVKVVDIFNNATTYEKIFGPYRFDTTPPKVAIKAYVRNATNSYKEGEEVFSLTIDNKTKQVETQKTKNGKNNERYLYAYNKGQIKYDKYDKLYNKKWLNNTNYPKGIYYKIEYEDNIAISEEKWQHNEKDNKTKNDNSKKLNDGTVHKLSGKLGSVGEYLEADGYRRGYITVTDGSGNYVEVDLDAYIDLTNPGCKSDGGSTTWVNKYTNPGYRRITGKCSDDMSECKETDIHYDYTDDMDTKKGPGTVYDNAGNHYTCPADQTVKIDKTPPSKPTITNPPNGWRNSDFSLTLTSSDNLSGINNYEYSYNQSSWTVYANSAKISFTTTNFTTERKQNVYLRVKDVAGNYSENSSTMIQLDKTAPKCTTNKSQTSDNNGWVNASDPNGKVTISASCSDPKGSAESSVPSECQPVPAALEFTTDMNVDKSPGSVTDYAGNVGQCESKKVKIDKTKPTITISTAKYASYSEGSGCTGSNLGSYPAGTWTNDQCVSVSTTFSDNLSGVAKRSYTTTGFSNNANNTTISSNSFTKAKRKESDSTLTYYVTDNAGNASENSVNVKLDRTAPTISFSLRKWSSYTSGSGCTGSDVGAYDDDKWTNDECVKLTASFSDALSGISTRKYSRTGFSTNKTNESVSNPHTVSKRKESDSDITYTITDNAGNVATKNANIKLDRTQPSCSVTIGHQDETGGVSVSASCSDSGSNIRSCYSGTTGATSEVSHSKDSSYKAVDNAGNSKACPKVTVTSTSHCYDSYYYADCKSWGVWSYTSSPDFDDGVNASGCSSNNGTYGNGSYKFENCVHPTAYDSPTACKCDRYDWNTSVCGEWGSKYCHAGGTYYTYHGSQ